MSPKIIMTIIVVLVMSGCVSYALSYSTSVDNVMAMKEINGLKLNVGSFTASDSKEIYIGCPNPLGPRVKVPDGQTFESFIKDAFVEELKIADAYSASAPITLTGNLDATDLSGVPGTLGMWYFTLTVNSSNGNSLSVSERYSFEVDYDVHTACYQVGQEMVPAVQNLIGKVVTNSKFESLIN